MTLKLLVNADDGKLLVIDSAEALKYANEYRTVEGLCLYSATEVCAAFAEFVNKGVQLRIPFG